MAAQHAPIEWHAGDVIPIHGVETELRVEHAHSGTFLGVGGERVRLERSVTNLRPAAEIALRQIAVRELIPRLHELAARHSLTVRRAVIRNQRSRWGSCSRTGAIALNFRLVQMPPSVSDYVLVHELMHIKQQNHSRRYWRLVEQACPDFRAAERWLRVEGRSLF